MTALDNPELSCPICKEQYVALGITDEARDRAATEGPWCCQPTDPPAAAGGGEAPATAGVTEAWRSLPGYGDRYEVSSEGRVRWAARPARILASNLSDNGYLRINLTDNGIRVTRYIHRLVLEAFIGPLPPGLVSRHLNGDRLDNRADNLRYGTYQENTRDAFEHGTRPVLQAVRKTHCKRGHEFTPENTSIRSNGERRCRACARYHCSSWRRRQRGMAA